MKNILFHNTFFQLSLIEMPLLANLYAIINLVN